LKDIGFSDRKVPAMRIYLDCISCFIRQALCAARLATDDEQIHQEVVQGVLRLASRLDMSQSPPAIGQQMHRLIRELIGSDDPYRRVKTRFNNLALRLYPELRKRIMRSEDRLETAIRLAIAGNIIDFGANGSLEEPDVNRAIRESLAVEPNRMQLSLFRDATVHAETILYIADNAGEIVFDRLLIEQLPYEKVTVVVKGKPVINDATIEDADVAGLTRIVEVIDNGSDAPGTILQDCSATFHERFSRADMVIAKGQGNYETLSGVDKNVFFLLKVKCPVIARDIGCSANETVLRRSAAFGGGEEGH